MLYVSYYNRFDKLFSVMDTDDLVESDVTLVELMNYVRTLAMSGVRIAGVEGNGKVRVLPDDFTRIREDTYSISKDRCLSFLRSMIHKYGRNYHCMLDVDTTESRIGWDYMDLLDEPAHFSKATSTLQELYNSCAEDGWFGLRVIAYAEYAGVLFLRCANLWDKENPDDEDEWED